MAKLISDFFCVAESGSTIDDREIKPQWLLDAAQDYNADFYAARIWFEHIRYFGAMGDVFAVKAEKDEETGIVRLFNRIIPSTELIELKQRGRLLYSSVEVKDKLKRTGKGYQIGLGVTDSPASFSTDRMEFATKHLEEGALFTAAMEVPDLEFSKQRNIFDFFRKPEESHSKNQQPNKPEENHSQDDIEMNKEEFNSAFDTKMNELLGKQETVFTTVLETQRSSFKEEMESAIKPLKEKLEQQETQLNEFKTQQQEIIELAKKPGGDGDDRDPHTGGDGDDHTFSC